MLTSDGQVVPVLLAVWALAGAACAAGVRMGMRPSKPGEDLSREIFPDQ